MIFRICHGPDDQNNRRRICRQRGATVLEFAFVLPLLLISLGAIWDFGRAMYSYHFISAAARQAARWASVRGSESFVGCPGATSPCPATAAQIQSYVQSFVPPGMTYVSGATIGQIGYLGINQTSSPGSPCTTSQPYPWPGCGADGLTNSTSNSAEPCSPPPYNSPGCLVSVQVQYSYNFFLLTLFYHLVPGETGPGTITMVSTGSEVISQ